MKAIKSFLTVSVLAATGVANAAIVNTYMVGVTSVSSGLGTSSFTGTGTATFDDSGLLRVDYAVLQTTAAGTVSFSYRDNFYGTISAGSFTNTSGTWEEVSCTPVAGTASCPIYIQQPHLDLSATPATGNGGGLLEQTFDINAGGTNTATIYSLNHLAKQSLIYNLTPTVPVPAAAWLFGSGLLGLSGVVRRKAV